jgi:hypothetical protein
LLLNLLVLLALLVLGLCCLIVRLQNLFNVEALVCDLLEISEHHLLSILQHHDLVTFPQELKLVRD